ncbi:hypothetical protein, partial [Umezawaea sp.]|uniref:hypothetical protein n=1 Tax=Umezawaea sp. TaxID=1955258 RepID=UPI002ED2AE20
MGITKSSNQQLLTLVANALELVSHYLNRHYEFDLDAVSKPDHRMLTRMLVELGQPYGQFVLYALLLSNVPASPLAVEHEASLRQAIGESVETNLPECRVVEAVEAETSGETGRALQRTESSVSEDVSNLDLIRAEAQLAELRGFAETIAFDLRSLAADVEAGVPLFTEIDARLSEYSRRRGGLIEAVALLVEVQPSVGFDGLGERMEECRASRVAELRAREIAAGRIRDLDRQIAELEAMVESAPEIARDSLRTALEAMRIQRGELGAGTVSACTAELVAEPVVAEQPVLDSVDGLSDESDERSAGRPEPVTSIVKRDETRTTVVESSDVDVVPTDVAVTTSETLDDDPQSSGAEELAHGFPWEEGDPPLAVRLTYDGRIAEAYWVTAMSGEPDRRAAVLRFAAAAYGVHNNSDATAILAALDLDAQALGMDMDAAVVATTAILRAGLIAGWGHSLLAQLQPDLTLPAEWAALVDASIAAVRRSFRVDYGVGVLPPEDDVSEARVELGRRARSLADELPRRKNSYQRATRVLQRLMLTDQPLASALHSVIAWSDGAGEGAAVGEAHAALSTPGAAEAIIEAADAAMRKPKQAREPIVATALRALLRAIDEVRIIVREADVVSRRLAVAESDDRAVTAGLSRALADVESVPVPQGMAGAAMALFRSWLQDPA